jgi:uncharacterized protein YbcV (DUF1398 family)
MDALPKSIAKTCFDASYAASMDFPAIIGTLIGAGFEGYIVDYRTGTTTYYLAEGDSVAFDNPPVEGAVATAFDGAGLQVEIRKAQTKAPGYTYRGFCAQAKRLGCAGYIVSFPGRRVVYFGRTAETHLEHFPKG